MLGREHEADLAREAAKFARADSLRKTGARTRDVRPLLELRKPVGSVLFGGAATFALVLALTGSSASGASAWHPGPRSVGSLAIDPTQRGVVYAGSGVGVFKTLDGGATWSNTSSGIGEPVVLDVVLDPRRSRVVYAATNAGLFKSTDGGASWTARLARKDVVQVALDPSNPKVAYAGAMSAVFKSTDSGGTWRRVLSFRRGQWALALAVDPNHPRTVLAGTGAGVFKTADGARHWRSANRGLPIPSGRDRFEGFVRAFAIDPREPTTIYLGTERGFFRSTNGGERWVRSSANVAPPGVWTLALDPRNARVVYAGSYEGVYKSSDGGESWRYQSAGLSQGNAGEQPWIEAVAVDPSSPRVVYAGGAGGVFKSADAGGAWQLASPFTPPNGRVVSLTAAAPAVRVEKLAAHCSPGRHICYGVFSRRGRVILQINAAGRFLSRYTLCVTLLPRGDGAEHAQRCGAFPLFRQAGSSWGSSVDLARQYIGLPGARPNPGQYQVTWRHVCSKCPAKMRRHSALGKTLGRSLYFRWP